VIVTVSDGELSASCSSTVTVVEVVKPNTAPKIECLTTTVDVASGGSIELKTRASDPDGDRLATTWSSTGGSVSGSGESGTFNAAAAKGCPLAEKLFAIPGVSSLLLLGDFITVNKTAGSDWGEITPRVKAVLAKG